MFGSKAVPRKTIAPPDQRIALLLALVLLIVSTAPGPATTVMLDQVAGPYEITVGASPAPLKVGRGHLSILVQKHSNALIVKDVEVTVKVRPLDEERRPVTRQATHEHAADERQYGASFEFDTPGRWEIVVDVQGPEGPEAVQFQVTVERNILIQPVVYLMMVAIPLGGVFLVAYWLRSGGERPQKS